MLGDTRVDAALAPLLERLSALSAQPEPAAPPAPPKPTQPSRRLCRVSVLLLDLAGSAQRIQLRDPEQVQTVADGVLAAFTCIFKHHGDEVLRRAADKLKVAFGAHDTPCTREIDAERAAHCRLALLAEAARCGNGVNRLHGFEGFSAGVGIHTGGTARQRAGERPQAPRLLAAGTRHSRAGDAAPRSPAGTGALRGRV